MEVDADEAKSHLFELLTRAGRGEDITITRDGRAIARLVPVTDISIERRRAAINRLKESRKGQTLGIPIKQRIEEGRR